LGLRIVECGRPGENPSRPLFLSAEGHHDRLRLEATLTGGAVNTMLAAITASSMERPMNRPDMAPTSHRLRVDIVGEEWPELEAD
jgi:hypothetical protein